MASLQFEIVTGCLFIAVVEMENTNWILSDGGGLGGRRRVWISRFEIDPAPLSQWVEMSEIGAANMVHLEIGARWRRVEPTWCTLSPSTTSASEHSPTQSNILHP